jgi:hypothetical protein
MDTHRFCASPSFFSSFFSSQHGARNVFFFHRPTKNKKNGARERKAACMAPDRRATFSSSCHSLPRFLSARYAILSENWEIWCLDLFLLIFGSWSWIAWRIWDLMEEKDVFLEALAFEKKFKAELKFFKDVTD